MEKKPKIKTIAQNANGKSRVVYLPELLANNANFMRRNNLFKDEPVSMEAIGQIKPNLELLEKRSKELTDLGFTKDKAGDFVSPDGFTIIVGAAITITPQPSWDKSLERFYELTPDVSHETEDGIQEFKEEPAKEVKKTGRPKKA